MRTAALIGGIAGATASVAVLSRTLRDDYDNRLFTHDAGYTQHNMIGAAALGFAAIGSVVALAATHTRLPVVSGVAGGLAAGIAVGVVGSFAGARLLRDPDGSIPRMERV